MISRQVVRPKSKLEFNSKVVFIQFPKQSSNQLIFIIWKLLNGRIDEKTPCIYFKDTIKFFQMDLYLKKAKLVLFLDNLEKPLCDISKVKDLTHLALLGQDLFSLIRDFPTNTFIYLQKGIVDQLLIDKVSWFCDGQVDYSTNSWWFKTGSTRVVHGKIFEETKPKNEPANAPLPDTLDSSLSEKQKEAKEALDLKFGRGEAIPGFDSDDPDADLDI
jgi:hypothetical protein